MCVLEKDPETGQRRLKLDVSAVHAGEPRVLAEGLEGNTHFPVALLERGFKIKIEHGEATMKIDKRRILNTICRVHHLEIDDVEPCSEHNQYIQVSPDTEIPIRLGCCRSTKRYTISLQRPQCPQICTTMLAWVWYLCVRLALLEWCLC